MKPEDEAQIKKLKNTLQTHSLEYSDNYRVFGHGDKIKQKACDIQFLKDLKGSLEIVTKVNQSLDPNRGLYRGKALDFHRKTTAMKESLKELYNPLKQYCTEDQKIVESCLKNTSVAAESDGVIFWVNRHVRGYDLLHPLFRPNFSSPIAITTNTESKKDYRTILMTTGVQNEGAPISNLIDFTTEAELLEISACLKKAKTQSSISELIKLAALNSFKDAERECNAHGYMSHLKDFCILDPSSERFKNLLLNRPDFKKYFKGLQVLKEVLEITQDELGEVRRIDSLFYRQSQPLDPNDPFAFLDEIEGETEEQRVARVKLNLTSRMREVLDRITVQSVQLENIVIDYPILYRRVIFRPEWVRMSAVFSDKTEKRLINLLQQDLVNEQVKATLSSLNFIKTVSGDIESNKDNFDSSLLKDLKQEYKSTFERLDKALTWLRIPVDPDSILEFSEIHEQILWQLLEYDK